MVYADFVSELQAYYGSKKPIFLHEPLIEASDCDLVTKALESGFVSSIGQYVSQFEELVAEVSNSKYCVALVNGTCALHLALLAGGVNEGDMVITQSLSFVATANAIAMTGALPAFVDVDSRNFGMCPVSLMEFINKSCKLTANGCVHVSSGRKVSAVVPMHTFGMPCKAQEIRKICDFYSIRLIEDAAEALGSGSREKKCGSFGDIGVFSFNGNKIVTTGGGGAAVTNSRKLFERMKHVATTAKLPHKYEFIHDCLAYNYRMPNLNAALGCSQLSKLSHLLREKQKLYDFYADLIRKYNFDLNLFKPIEGVRSNNWLISVQCRDQKRRDEFLDLLLVSGINVRIPWRPLHMLKMYSENERTAMRNTMKIYGTVINLPSSPWSRKDV